MAEITLGQRMRAAAEHVGLTQKEVGCSVARMIKRARGAYSEAAVGQWYADKHEPELEALKAFSKLVDVDLFWLQTGFGNGLGRLPKEGRLVPIMTMEQALKLQVADDKPTPSGMVHTYFPCSDTAFAIDITDGRNDSPDGSGYRIGFKVVIDPQRKPVPGKMVLAVVDKKGIFGEYQEKTGKRIVIHSLNSKWPDEIFNAKRGDYIVGTMTEFAGQAS